MIKKLTRLFPFLGLNAYFAYTVGEFPHVSRGHISLLHSPN